MEVVDRAGREKDFFNRKNHEVEISDELLKIPKSIAEIPPEVSQHFPTLEDTDVCEIGCGYGMIACYFAARGARVFGIDVADSNIAVAQRSARVNGVAERVRFQVMQAEWMNFPDNKFDFIFGNAVLHHLDVEASAREFWRVLKPGGVAIFREPLGENPVLEWGRGSRLRSAKHRHTADERSFTYRDLETLRSVFPHAKLRESEMLGLMRAVFRKVDKGMMAIPRWESLMRRLSALDTWLFSHCAAVRPLASYGVISMTKPLDQPIR